MGIQSGKRDELSQETLMELKSLETLVKMRIRKLIEKENALQGNISRREDVGR